MSASLLQQLLRLLGRRRLQFPLKHCGARDLVILDSVVLNYFGNKSNMTQRRNSTNILLSIGFGFLFITKTTFGKRFTL